MAARAPEGDSCVHACSPHPKALEEVDGVKTPVRPHLIDDLMDLYVEWREECAAVREAYAHWAHVPSMQKEPAFVAYRFALDREERASAVYADRVDHVARELAA
jgi:hypothetical protein